MTLIKHLSFVIGFEFYVLSDRSLIAKNSLTEPSSFVKKFQNASLCIVSHIIKGVQSVCSNKNSVKKMYFNKSNEEKEKKKSCFGKNSTSRDSIGSITTGTSESTLNEDTAEHISIPLKRNVSFSTIETRTYNITIGDHPGGKQSNGTPISLDWDYDECNVHVNEISYSDQEETKRSMKQLYLPPYLREWMLSGKDGYTSVEIRDAAETAKQMRRQRNKTDTLNCITTIRMQQMWRGILKRIFRLFER